MSVAINNFLYHLPYDDIFGGVSAMTAEHFKQVNVELYNNQWLHLYAVILSRRMYETYHPEYKSNQNYIVFLGQRIF